MNLNIERSNPIYAWPTPLYQFKIVDQKTISAWRRRAIALLPSNEKIKEVNGLRPWASKDTLQDTSEWSDVVEFLLSESSRVLTHQGILRQSHYVSSMWVNAGFQHQNHVIHSHPNSIISGCLYLQIPEKSANIMFYDPRPQTTILRPRLANEDGFLSFSPQEGSMLMWNSWLQHSTESFIRDEIENPRITLAFNIMIRDLIDSPGSRLHLF